MTTKIDFELLLPVGNMSMCHAAIHNGADAIYVGVPEFNARGRSVDYNLEELKEIIDLCRLYGVKVHLALNIVIFQEECAQVLELVKKIIPLGPDSFIVQDLGMLTLLRALSPEIPLHASTQMTITNFETLLLLADLKLKRVVLGREVSIEEMKKIRQNTQIELEVFVHGALCVAYSGQCNTSESIGGRSANRGQCAQSCRFDYELQVDGRPYQLVAKDYLLSPYDLCGIPQIPELCDLNINSFKVEGRLKSPEYVASAAKNYRLAIDHYRHQSTPLEAAEVEVLKNEMSKTYSRGFYSGWLKGVNHQALVGAKYKSHRGPFLGVISKIDLRKKVFYLKTHHHFQNGDGLLIADLKKGEWGGPVYSKTQTEHENEWAISLGGQFPYQEINCGMEVYHNSDKEVSRELRKTFEDQNQKKKIGLKIKVELKKWSPLKVSVIDSDGNQLELFSKSVLIQAEKAPTQFKHIEAEFKSLGPTIFKLDELLVSGEEDGFIHAKELKELRREFTEKMMVKRCAYKVIGYDLNYQLNFKKRDENHASLLLGMKLNILLRESGQVEDLISAFLPEKRPHMGIIYLDFEFGKDYVESVRSLKKAGYRVGIATTRILKPSEYHNFTLIERANPDVILVRNLGAAYYFRHSSFVLKGDFSLNVTNVLTVDYLLAKKLTTLTASYDLNESRLKDLLLHSPVGSIEVTAHQYMPSFHMEHCVFAAFLGPGKSFRDCGKPCETHKVTLVDQFKNHHFIKADQECRNTMFNEKAQSALRFIAEWGRCGVREIRYEALFERKDELILKISTYLDYLDALEKNQKIPLGIFKEKLNTSEKYGLSEGHLGFHQDYRPRKKQRE